MKSIATGHFPRLIRDHNKTWLFNPVLKKRFANRPEERVRLKWVEYLIHQTEWSKSRIGFEAPVTLHRDGSTLRADLVLYTQNMKPHILVECKSGSVSLTPAVAEQAARYNSRVMAPYLVLTNGVQDYWFEQKEGSIKPAEPPFEETEVLRNIYESENYWTSRGFYSPKSSPEVQTRLKKVLPAFWKNKSRENRFLDFKESFLPFPMNHFYRIVSADDDIKMAAGFLGAPESGSFLVGIMNRKGMNEGVVVVNLDDLEAGKRKSVTLFEGKKGRQTDISRVSPDFIFEPDPGAIENLPLFLMRFFD
ncbi:MAG: type I restriction enzyme HsdR N-terminal domain-containing protein [Balneolaceae bacterium]